MQKHSSCVISFNSNNNTWRKVLSSSDGLHGCRLREEKACGYHLCVLHTCSVLALATHPSGCPSMCIHVSRTRFCTLASWEVISWNTGQIILMLMATSCLNVEGWHRQKIRPGRSDIGEDLIRANSAMKHTSPQEIISSKQKSAIYFTEGYFKTIYKLNSGQRVTGFKQVVMRKN